MTLAVYLCIQGLAITNTSLTHLEEGYREDVLLSLGYSRIQDHSLIIAPSMKTLSHSKHVCVGTSRHTAERKEAHCKTQQ